MRQVNHDELAWKILRALRPVSPTTWKEALDRRPDVRRRAVAEIADAAASGLQDLEVLSSAPAADTSFTRPMERLLGYKVETGAAKLD